MEAKSAVVHIDGGRDSPLPWSKKVGGNRSHRRIAGDPVGTVCANVSCQQPMGGRPVIAIAVGKAANDGALVHHLPVVGHLLRDVHAGDV